jgi:hypothetical protein
MNVELGESKNTHKKSGLSQHLRYEMPGETQTNVITMINTLNAIGL